MIGYNDVLALNMAWTLDVDETSFPNNLAIDY